MTAPIDLAKYRRLGFELEQHRASTLGLHERVRTTAERLRATSVQLASTEGARVALATKHAHLKTVDRLDRETLRRVPHADLLAVGILPEWLEEHDAFAAALASARKAAASAQAELNQRDALQQNLDRWVTDHA